MKTKIIASFVALSAAISLFSSPAIAGPVDDFLNAPVKASTPAKPVQYNLIGHLSGNIDMPCTGTCRTAWSYLSGPFSLAQCKVYAADGARNDAQKVLDTENGVDDGLQNLPPFDAHCVKA